jgi:hypothetical protein
LKSLGSISPCSQLKFVASQVFEEEVEKAEIDEKLKDDLGLQLEEWR